MVGVREEKERGRAKEREPRYRVEDQEENQESMWLKWQDYIGKSSVGREGKPLGWRSLGQETGYASQGDRYLLRGPRGHHALGYANRHYS